MYCDMTLARLQIHSKVFVLLLFASLGLDALPNLETGSQALALSMSEAETFRDA